MERYAIACSLMILRKLLWLRYSTLWHLFHICLKLSLNLFSNFQIFISFSQIDFKFLDV